MSRRLQLFLLSERKNILSCSPAAVWFTPPHPRSSGRGNMYRTASKPLIQWDIYNLIYNLLIQKRQEKFTFIVTVFKNVLMCPSADCARQHCISLADFLMGLPGNVHNLSISYSERQS